MYQHFLESKYSLVIFLHRWFWFIVQVWAFGCAATIVASTLQRFLTNPTYLVQLESVEDVIDFPTVFVCPEIAFTKTKIRKFLSTVNIPPGLNETYLTTAIQELTAFFSLDVEFKVDVLADVERLLKYNNIELDTAGRLLTRSCEETFEKCRWNGKLVNCTSIFTMEFTGDGYCCVFNGRSLRKQYINNKEDWRTGSVGAASGMIFAVTRGQKPVDINTAYKWVAIDFGGVFVEGTFNGTPLSPGIETWAKYSIKRFQINENAVNLGESLTKCRMSDYQLKYFPVYLRKYCNIECEIKRTLDICGCLAMVHPKLPGAEYCNAHQLQCSRQVKVAVANSECDCPSSCNFVENNVVISNFVMMQNSHPIDHFYEGLDLEHVSVVRVFVSGHSVKTNSQWSYYNEFVLFSQLGGTFNVFVGCSVLTVLELIVLAIHGIRDLYELYKSRKNKVEVLKDKCTSNVVDLD